MLLFVYVLAVVIAVGNLILITRRGKMQNVYIVLCGYTVVVSNAGYLALAVANNIDTAILANKITYLGGCFTPLFVFMLVAELCNIKINKKVIFSLVAYSIVVLCMVFSIGYCGIYYKAVELHKTQGISYITKTYGPAHTLYTVLLYGYMIATLLLLVYAFFQKTKVSYKTVLILGTLILLSSVVYIVERKLHSVVDWMPIIYDIDIFITNIMLTRVDMYDMSTNVMNAWKKMEEYGYITFDRKKRYMGCNSLALKYFESLSKCKVDYHIPKQGIEQLDRILEWVEEYQENVSEDMKIYEIDNKIIKFKMKALMNKRNNKQIGYLLEFFDITKEQQYVKMIENYNVDLERGRNENC